MNNNLYYNCPCGSFFKYDGKTQHIKTKKHIKYIIDKNLSELDICYNIGCIFDLENDVYSVVTAHYN